MGSYIIPGRLVEKLSKGDSIAFKEIRYLIPDHVGESQRRVFVVEWAAHLSRALADAGKPCTVVTREGSHRVDILTDPEASEYNREAFRTYIRRARQRHSHMADVDPTRLSDVERRDHERAFVIQAAKLAAIDNVRRIVPVRAHERATPAVKIRAERGAI